MSVLTFTSNPFLHFLSFFWSSFSISTSTLVSRMVIVNWSSHYGCSGTIHSEWSNHQVVLFWIVWVDQVSNQLNPFQWESVDRSFLIFFSLCFVWYAFSILLAALFSSSILQNCLKANISFDLFVWISIHPFQCFFQGPFNILLSSCELTSECYFPF